MFRSKIKKRKKTITRLLRTDDDSDDDENTPGAVIVNKSKADKEADQKNQEDGDGTNEDDESESKTNRSIKDLKLKKNSQKKKKGLVIRSFEFGDAGDDDDDERKSSKKTQKGRKRKRIGLGFGGAPLTKDQNDGSNDDGYEKDQNDTHQSKNRTVFSVYDKEALNKLKQEQKYKVPVVQEDSFETTAVPQSSMEKAVDETHRGASGTPALDDYIPLTGKDNANMILTGDEALLFEDRNNNNNNPNEQRREDHFDTVMKDANFLDNDEEQQEAQEASAWEAEITRRAGIQGTTSTKMNPQSATHSTSYKVGQQSSSHTDSNTTSAVSLSKIRNQIQSTISQLELQHNDVDRASARRRTELSQTEAELQRQENELKDSGKALEDYQQLREQLTYWTGALRELKDKVQPIQEALIDLDADIANLSEWKDWEDDMCAILHQAGLLDRVLGRQPPDFVFEQSTTFVDEFGRDVKSQHAMNREKRTKKRLEVQSRREQAVNEDNSDALVDPEGVEMFRQRRIALGKALDISLEELEEDYTEFAKLVAIFRKWRASYPEDYRQCYANLSLGDLAGVLVHVELCKVRSSPGNCKGWLDGLSSDGDAYNSYGLFQWAQELTLQGDANNPESSLPLEEAIGRVVEKCFIPVLTNALDKSAYNLVSKKQSRSLSLLYAKLFDLKSERSVPGLEALTSRFVDYLRSSLENVAIVILNKADIDSTTNTSMADDKDDSRCFKKPEVKDAIRGATAGQLHRLSKMLVNILTYWSRQLQGKECKGFEDFLLDFLSSKYLFLLSSLRGRSDGITEAFLSVWNLLQTTKWLDQPGRMLQAAPLRAAAVAFNVA